MGFMAKINSMVKKFNWLDMGFIKLSVAAFVLLLAKLWTPLLSLDWYWYAVIFVLAVLKPLYTILK